MTVRVFVRWALAAPVIVPLPAYPLLRGGARPFDAVGQLLVGSVVVGMAPYLVFAAAFAAWARNRTAAGWSAPLLFLLPFALFWLLLVTVCGGGAGAVPMVMALSAVAVAVGYAYVAAADALYRLLARRGVIRSI